MEGSPANGQGAVSSKRRTEASKGLRGSWVVLALGFALGLLCIRALWITLTYRTPLALVMGIQLYGVMALLLTSILTLGLVMRSAIKARIEGVEYVSLPRAARSLFCLLYTSPSPRDS